MILSVRGLGSVIACVAPEDRQTAGIQIGIALRCAAVPPPVDVPERPLCSVALRSIDALEIVISARFGGTLPRRAVAALRSLSGLVARGRAVVVVDGYLSDHEVGDAVARRWPCEGARAANDTRALAVVR